MTVLLLTTLWLNYEEKCGLGTAGVCRLGRIVHKRYKIDEACLHGDLTSKLRHLDNDTIDPYEATEFYQSFKVTPSLPEVQRTFV